MNYPLSFLPHFILPTLFFLVLVLPGCKKTEEPPTPTNREKIIGTWIEKELWTDDDHDGTFVLHSEPCDGDATWTFNADGTQRVQDDTPCDVPFPIDITSTWTLTGQDDNQIKLIIPGLEDEPLYLMIDSLGEHELVLHTIWPDDPGAAAEDKMVLRR